MWTYQQSTGNLYARATEGDKGTLSLVGRGYAGKGEGRNNPKKQHVANVGPLPRGFYKIDLTPFDSPSHGPLCLRLTPLHVADMFGRSGFLIHGDSVRAPGTASKGCMIFARAIREQIATSGDDVLEVLE